MNLSFSAHGGPVEVVPSSATSESGVRKHPPPLLSCNAPTETRAVLPHSVYVGSLASESDTMSTEATMGYTLVVVMLAVAAGHTADIKVKNLHFSSLERCISACATLADQFDQQDPDGSHRDMFVGRACKADAKAERIPN